MIAWGRSATSRSSEWAATWKLVAFNVDLNFADALDGLIVVDFAQTDSGLLDRYVGRDGARLFLEYWERADRTIA
jgi:hypothetical protein